MAVLPLLAACGGPFSALEPEGPSARGAATLWWIMLAGFAAIFLMVSAVLALALWKPRTLRTFGAERTMVWGGLVIPSVILTVLVAAALALGERLLAVPSDPAPLRIEAIARQWVWEFRYPDGRATSGRLVMPVGEDVDFAVTSEDVIHAFWIPRLGGKIDAIPGHENVVRLRADRAGVYGGVCAEFCGDGHAPMRFSVEAVEQGDFEARLAEFGAEGQQ
ncbi:cytochrome c oxidase subunit II [Mesorhizobium sp. CAU 1741]|uniref:cytochrome c oxidase subunit II n=1 Tax=Mesorhizobium sp. CAU 1741 TaxID=3140366 RepID=UPI00325AFD5E